MRLTLIILAIAALSSCIKEDPLNIPFESNVPEEIGDGLDISSPEAEGIDPLVINNVYNDIYDDENLWSLRSFLVFRHGKLVAESYLKDPANITERQLIWSSTKQVLAVVTGVAIDRGIINSLDDPISDYLGDELEGHDEKAGITLKQLITMHSGIDYSNDGIGGETDQLLQGKPDEIVPFILSLPMRNTPGTDFNYNDGDPHLLAAILQKAAGKSLNEWADENLFSRIGIYNLNWVRYKDGTTLGGYGIETTPRELAKLALCIADSGNYKGEQLVPKSWIRDMTAVTSPSTFTSYAAGYYWWIDTSRGIHFTWGHGGQFAFIIPSEDLVIVATSIPNTQGDYQVSADEVMPYIDRIIEACN